MKKKKKVFIIGGIALAAVVAVILLIVLLPKEQEKLTPAETRAESKESESVMIDEPESDSKKQTESKTEKAEGTAITPKEETEPAESKPEKVKVNAETVATPVIEAKPETNPVVSGGEVIHIGGNTPPEPEEYHCGTPGHHCKGPEDHAFIQNLELEGCQYCGSHSCPSFYAVDQWGNACYTPSECPKYNIHSDSVYYCQTCGKKCGDGTGGSCVQFVEACNCPLCGEFVEARTCHSCK